MLKNIRIATILLLFSATLALAAVSEEQMNIAKTGGYTEGLLMAQAKVRA